MDRQVSLTERLREGYVIFDGAMGSMLQARHGSYPFEEMNISAASEVAAVHREYLEVGAEVIVTNTFGANRLNLNKYGLADRMREINAIAANLARGAISESKGAGKRYVAGSIGPVWLPCDYDDQVMIEAFKEQAILLLSVGVDCLILETFYSSEDAALALIGTAHAKVKTRSDAAVILSFAPTKAIKAITIELWRPVLSGFRDLGADYFGLNCGAGPVDLVSTATTLSLAGSGPLILQPSAGEPCMGETISNYPIGPDQFASEVHAMLEPIPTCAVGGCCGSTPGHIRALREALRTQKN